MLAKTVTKDNPGMTTLRAIIDRYKNNERLIASHADIVRQNIADSSQLSDRVKQLAAAGSAVSWFAVRPVGARKTRMLHLLYAEPNGNRGAVPISLAKLQARPPKRAPSTRKLADGSTNTPKRKQALAICRALIGDQIADFRTNFWATHFAAVRAAVAAGEDSPRYPRCRLSGRSLWSNKSHVDHQYPFLLLVNDWLAVQCLTFDQLSPKPRKCSLGSEALDASWSHYHQQHAVLELLYAQANLQKGAKVAESEIQVTETSFRVTDCNIATT